MLCCGGEESTPAVALERKERGHAQGKVKKKRAWSLQKTLLFFFLGARPARPPLHTHTQTMHRTRQRQRPAYNRAGLAMALALLCLAGLCFAALPARASTDAARASAVAAAAGASSDLPPAVGSAAGAGAGSAGGVGGGGVGGPAPPAELTAATLAPALGALPPASPVLLEFYAHWCPTCRRFQPEYEKASAGLAGKSGSSGGGAPVFVARLDCADEVRKEEEQVESFFFFFFLQPFIQSSPQPHSLPPHHLSPLPPFRPSSARRTASSASPP